MELIKANVDVAKRCFTGCKNVNPGIVKVPVELKSLYGQAALANAIPSPPDTITMEITEEEGQTYYYIHWIDARLPGGEEAGEEIKGRAGERTQEGLGMKDLIIFSVCMGLIAMLNIYRMIKGPQRRTEWWPPTAPIYLFPWL